MILCHERNYRYAALHNGSQCACLNKPEYKRLEKVPNEVCDVPCVVNDEELCGGNASASVFWAVASSILSADEKAAGLNGERECPFYFKQLQCSNFSCVVVRVSCF